MAKMYRIKDDEGKEYEVKEVEEETVNDDEIVEEETVEEEAPLTSEEIRALRALLAQQAGGMEDEEEDLDEDEVFEEENLEEEEEVVDTAACDSKKKKGIKDSAISGGVQVEDSIDDVDDREEKIAQEWAKRFK